METLKNVGYVLLVLGSWALTAFCTFKSRQLSGKDYVNEWYTDVGHGSFLDSIMFPLKRFFWEIIGLICLVIAICLSFLLLGKFLASDETLTKAKSSEPVKVEQSVPKETKEASKPIADQEVPKGEVTAEEIRQMEIEKQYSGDDPVIRQRLGLPPKNNQ
jgi:hypothetical protein